MPARIIAMQTLAEHLHTLVERFVLKAISFVNKGHIDRRNAFSAECASMFVRTMQFITTYVLAQYYAVWTLLALMSMVRERDYGNAYLVASVWSTAPLVQLPIRARFSKVIQAINEGYTVVQL